MRKNVIIKYCLYIVVFFIVGFIFFNFKYNNVLAASGAVNEAIGGLKSAGNVVYSGQAPTPDKVNVSVVVSRIIRIILGFVGVAFMLLIVYGGITWMFGARSGKEGEVNKAKTIIINASIGLALVLGAYVITVFVVKNLIKIVS